MNNKIKTAFEEITADEQLKNRTKSSMLAIIEKQERKNTNLWKKAVLIPVCAVFVCFLSFGFISYNIQVSAISIDINPSIELGLNQYDRVISVKSFNADGDRLVNSVSVNNMTYEEAAMAIMDSKETQKYMSSDNIIVFTVDTSSGDKADEVIKNIRKCNSNSNEMYCYKNSEKCTEEAHSQNISFGKYNAYLELKKYEPNVTVDEIRNMTMRQIRDRIQQYSGDAYCEDDNSNTVDCTSSNGNSSCSDSNDCSKAHNGGNHYGKEKN